MYLHILGHNISRENNEPLTFYEKNTVLVGSLLEVGDYSIIKHMQLVYYDNDFYTCLLRSFAYNLHSLYFIGSSNRELILIKRIKILSVILREFNDYKIIRKYMLTYNKNFYIFIYDSVFELYNSVAINSRGTLNALFPYEMTRRINYDSRSFRKSFIKYIKKANKILKNV